MEDYRARLEPILMEELLDENGEFKDEYKNDPEMSKWGMWAKAQHDKSVIQRDYDVLSDPSQPREAIEATLQNIESYDFNESRQLHQTDLISGADNNTVKEATNTASLNTDNALESQAEQGDGLNAFLNAGPSV